MGTVWDPSPETQYHVLPVALSFEFTRLPGESGAESVRPEVDVEAASERVGPNRSRQYTAINANMPERAILVGIYSKYCDYRFKMPVLWVVLCSPYRVSPVRSSQGGHENLDEVHGDPPCAYIVALRSVDATRDPLLLLSHPQPFPSCIFNWSPQLCVRGYTSALRRRMHRGTQPS